MGDKQEKSGDVYLLQIWNRPTSIISTTANISNMNKNEYIGAKESGNNMEWMGAHFNLLQVYKMKKWILFDNQSTLAIFADQMMY